MRSNFNRYVLFLLAVCSFYSLFAQNAKDPDPNRFKQEIDQFFNWDQKNSFPSDAVLFVGSSSIRMWHTADDFPQYPVINRGFGGSHISDVNYFYDLIVKKYKPKVIVFYAGDNDVADGKSVSQVFEDFTEFAGRANRDFPAARILYLPIKPSLSRWQFWGKMNEVNMKVKQLCDEKKELVYADIATPMLGADGKPKPELFLEDGLHLNEAGYALWNSVLKDYLDHAEKH